MPFFSLLQKVKFYSYCVFFILGTDVIKLL